MKLLFAIFVSIVSVCPLLALDDYSVELLNEPLPAEIAEPIRAELNSTGLRVKSGEETLCDIWFRKSIPQEAPSGIGRSYPGLPDMTLIGAARVVGQMTDNRHNTFPKGVYTIRHGIQPQDGNHAGSTEFIDFALFLNATTDKTVDGGFANSMAMIRRSLADGGAGHPVVFNLLPPKSSTLPSINRNERDHWVLEAKAGDTVLAMILVGFYEH
jgi:hypothetical protein